MRISSINQRYISFGIKSPGQEVAQSRELFKKMLEVNPLSRDVLSQKEDDYYDRKLKANISSPFDGQLQADVKKIKRPLPFSLSDKRLNLDEYQAAAIEHFRDGKNVMVTAPTGTGKTLIAEHAINDILSSGQKVIYTTPLKALCNDKYKQFCALWGDYDDKGNLIGKSKVGLATGDIKINTKAPLVIMTTEVYRNMLIRNGKKDLEKELKDVSAVIFDEFHYMGDRQRGSVWEESLIFSPEKIKFLMLSATIANAKPVNDWLNGVNSHHQSVVVNVPEDERHVPLKYLSYANIKGKLQILDLLDEKISLNNLKTKNLSSKEREAMSSISDLFNGENAVKVLETKFRDIFCNFGQSADIKDFINRLIYYGMPRKKAEQCALRLTDKSSRKINKVLEKNIGYMNEMPLISLVRDMEKRDMTPALYFVYSKRNCKNYMQETSEKIGQLLTDSQRAEVQRRIDEVMQKGVFLGTDFEKDVKQCLLNGFAMHHSGMLPQCKSFIEELGRNKLIKVCFATDTLGAGINFPFKTVVFEDFEKYTDEGLEEISINSFKQGAGRAGRRGIDEVGYVVSVSKDAENIEVPFSKIVEEADDIQSAFSLSYGLVLAPRFLNQPINIMEKSFDNYQKKNYDENMEKCDSMRYILKRRNFVEANNGILKHTQKGKIASKVRGINELLLTELITNPKVIEGISPSELAGIISIFTPEKLDKFNVPYFNKDSYMKKVEKAIDIAQDIKNTETECGINSNISINTNSLPYIKLWVDTDNDENKVLWKSMISSMLSKKIITSEGEFVKKINYVTNILKLLEEIAPTTYIKNTATSAIKLLQKSPVNDILLYELDYKEKENNE